MSEKEKKRHLTAIFLVLLSDITAFGMIIPLVPILARDFGAEGLIVGLLISSYSVLQFLTAPFWGRLSDTFGRKPIIVLGLFGSALSHLVFAFSGTVGQIFLSRLLAGFFGGNIIIASAYIADKTSLKKRSKNLSLVGMAFGAGFTLGPLLGFLFILMGERVGEVPPFGMHFAATGATILSLITAIMTFFFLKESLSYKKSFSEFFQKQSSSLFHRPSFRKVQKSLMKPGRGLILMMSFLLWFSLAQIEPVLILFLQDDFLWNQKTAYGSFVYIGILMVFSQGYLVRKFIPLWGEAGLGPPALFVMTLGLFFIALSGPLISHPFSFLSLSFLFLLTGVTFFSIGYSLSNTSLNGALSLLSSDKEQGSIFGVNQSLSALARIIGPAGGGLLYQRFSHESPFAVAGLFTFVACFMAFYSRKTFPNKGLVKREDLLKEQKAPAFKASQREELELFALNRFQLKNLVDKNISFSFFQLEDFSVDVDSLTKRILLKAEKKTGDELLLCLKKQDSSHAIVLICERGDISRKMAQNLRDKGFINAYFIKGGLIALLSERF